MRAKLFETVSPDRRRLMARVKGKNSKPELAVRSAAHALGFRFRLHRRDLPGTPDLVFPRVTKAIFVHGCFWHRHQGCSRTTHPKTRADYWENKFAENVARDTARLAELQALGWETLVIWECETFDPDELLRRLGSFLGS